MNITDLLEENYMVDADNTASQIEAHFENHSEELLPLLDCDELAQLIIDGAAY